MRHLALLLAAATGCAHAEPSAATVSLEATPRGSARSAAATVQIWIRNDGPGAARVALDPGAFRVDVSDAGGRALACDAARESGEARLLAAGERAGVEIDLTRRCGLAAPGEYRVEVRSADSGAPVTVMLRVTRWVNPGPLPARRPTRP